MVFEQKRAIAVQKKQERDKANEELEKQRVAASAQVELDRKEKHAE